MMIRRGVERVLGAGVTVMLVVSGVNANGDEHQCPAAWHEYVEILGEIIEPLGPNFPLLFVNREGDVFDCLNLVRDPDFIERATFIERALPLDRTSMVTADPETWPVNMCTGGSGMWPNMEYFTLHLPMETVILETEICRIRVFRSAERLVQNWR